MQTKKLLILTGGLILILGSRLPWMSVPVLYGLQGPAYESIEIGWEDNGLVTGGIGLILFLGAVLWRGRAKAGFSIPAAILAVYAALIVIGCFLSILEMDPPAGFFAATDIGIYVSLIGSFLTLVGTAGAVIMSFRNNRRRTLEATGVA
ncbi:hypothetical protein ANAEL_01028 [Anaerolineales bacterium]|nr:hypothetical protein ANAEL_01028 [Anaerolineales bacterium]